MDFVIAPEWFLTPGFASCPLFEDTYSVVVDRNNPELGQSISLEQYRAARHVSFENKGPPMFEAWFDKQYPGERRVEVTVASFNLLAQLVLGTGRVATMHTRLALKACDHWPVRAVRLDFAFPAFLEKLQWHQYRDHDPGLLWIREQVLRHAGALPALPGA